MVVWFRPRVSAAVASAILARCGSGAVVTKIGPIGPAGINSRALSAVVFTRVIGAGPRSDGLLRCLHRSGGVTGAGWPD